jgi:hypothetical protein
MSKQIWTDENGNPIDYLALRNEEIKDKLDEVLKLLLVEKAADKKGVKRFGYRMTVQLDSCLRSYGLMRADEFCDLTYDEIEDNFNRFQDLIAYYNRFFEVVADAFKGDYKNAKADGVRELLQELIEMEIKLDPLRSGIRYKALIGYAEENGVEVE